MGSFILVLIAPFVGSFLGVLVRRMSRGQSVVWPGSHCEACGTRLGPAEMVPIASFLWQRGRCLHCGAAIEREHLAVEIASVAVPAVLLVAMPWDDLPVLAAGSVLGWALLALGWIDWKSWRLPDAITLPLLLLGLGATWWLAPEMVTDHAFAASVAWVGLWGLRAGYRLVRGREGLGLGDVKLLAAAGAWVGLDGLAFVLLGGALAGLAMAAGRHGWRLSGSSAIPFGPALCVATWAVWIWVWGWDRGAWVPI